ncbi:MAG: hypothetical protein JSR58_05035 [Verrucomicrobia bacterium]|nr:hypothetical protein [Verrucomicrobiota bacterium]
MLKKISIMGVSLLFSYGIYFLTLGDYNQTKEFNLLNMLPHHPYESKWNIRPLSQEEKTSVHTILNQDFRYIGGGTQVYVLLSTDNKYVLKIFKQRRYTVPRWMRYLVPSFLSYREKKIGHIERTLERDFNSYKIAFEQLRDETALRFVHLKSPGDDFHHTVTLIDRENNKLNIDLHDCEFILQDKAEMVCPNINRHMESGDLAGAKASIDSLFELLYNRCKKKIDDSDPNLEKNYAFINDKAVQIDIGRFSLGEPQDFPHISEKFKNFLHNKYPELEKHYDEQYLAYSEKYAQ